MEFHFLHPSILNKEHLFSPVMPTLCYRSSRVVNCGFVKNLQGFFFKHWKKAIFWFRIYTSSDGPLDSRALALWVCLVFSVSCHVFLLSEESQPSPGIREAVAAACVHHLKAEWDRDVWLLLLFATSALRVSVPLLTRCVTWELRHCVTSGFGGSVF